MSAVSVSPALLVPAPPTHTATPPHPRRPLRSFPPSSPRSLHKFPDCLIERDMNGSVEPQTPPDSPGSLEVGVGKPPRHQLTSIRHCASSMRIAAAAAASSNYGLDLETLSLISPTDVRPGFLPVFRSGSFAEIGPKSYMEDEHVCVDNLIEHLGGARRRHPCPGRLLRGEFSLASQVPFHVFDGHGGTDAACFVRKNILKFIVEDMHFPNNVEKAIRGAFLKADHALADSHSLDNNSGTTALTALIFGRTLFVANAGDCRAVLGKRGRAVELSRDHKPNSKSEKIRIEKLGGTVFDGYLNGQLAVARALGDWHMKGPKGSISPLSAEPELQEIVLSEEDEFLIIGCDGLWDVMTSQCAVTIVRKELMQHNNPERCSNELVQEALKRDSYDNLTVVVICFSSNPPPQIDIPRTRVRRSMSLEGLHLLRGALDSNA